MLGTANEPFPIADDLSKLKSAVWKAINCNSQLDAALAYAEYGIPVLPCNWKYNDEGVLSKYPLVSRPGLYLATIDPIVIREWWTRWPKALIGVPGGWVTGMWFLDVDSKEHGGADGMEVWFDQIDRDGTAVTRSHQTGTEGLHFIFREDPNRPMRCQKGKLPPGIDVKGDGGYVILPPSPYERNGATVRYRVSHDIDPAPAPGWLYDLILGERPRSKSHGKNAGGSYQWPPGFGQRMLDQFCEIVRTAQEHHWDEARRKVFKFGKWAGGGAIDVNVALEALLNAARECRAPSDYAAEVKRAFLNGVEEPEGAPDNGVSLFDFYAYMPQHDYIYAPTQEHWPASSVNSRLGTVPVLDKDGNQVVNEEGEPLQIKASVWIDQNQPVEQMTWAPGEVTLIHDRLISDGGWIKRDSVTCFNLYRPPTIEPGDAAKAGPWIEHVHKVFDAKAAEHIIKWCAQRVQHPEIKINHALVLGSEEHGIGKDAMLEPVKRAVGPWNFGEVGPQQLLGRFNGFLKRVILRVNEARDLVEINRYQFYEHTKAFTASPPDVLRVDEKHQQEHSIQNCVGVIITTNYKTNGIFLPAEDRRHYVAWSNRRQDDFEMDYWNKLFGWYDAGGDRHVAAYLAGLDLSGFDAKAPPPKTEAFWDIVDANRSPEESNLADILDELGNPPAVTLRVVIEKAMVMDYQFGLWLQDRKNRRLIPNRFEKCDYVPVRNPDRADHMWKIAGKRQVVYAWKDLSVQEQLKAAGDLW
jgi:hypothetical protein